MKFELTLEEIEKIEVWKSEQIKKDPTQYLTGERWTYCFTPTGLGTIITVVDYATKDELMVRDFDLS